MTLMPRKLIAEQSSSAKIPAEDLRLALTGLWAPGALANTARSGVLRGSGAPGFLGCQVLSPSASTFTVKQGSFIVQQATTNGGAYIGVIDSDQTLSISASLPTSGNFKAGYVIARCFDSAYGDSQDGFDLETVLGAQASSVGATTYPALPSNALVLSGFTVTSTGAISLTTVPLYTATAGAILPVSAGDVVNGDHDGQWRDEPSKGLQRWFAAASAYSTGAAWARPLAGFLGSGTAFPTNAQRGDVFWRNDLGFDGGTLWVNTAHASNPWRYAEAGALQVANQAGRDAVAAAGVAYPGLRLVQADTGAEWEWGFAQVWIPIQRVVTGVGSVTLTVGQNSANVTIPFGTTFINPPAVTITGTGSSQDYEWVFWAINLSTTAFTCMVHFAPNSSGGGPVSSGAVTFTWIAAGQ